AVLTQSKRFPLVWDLLSTPLRTWRALLPETRSPRDVSHALDGDWVFKPALGHEGWDGASHEGIEPNEGQRIRAAAVMDPSAWAAQRRFDAPPLATPEGPMYPCVGVYVIDGRVAGAYGRMAARPLIDDRSRDVVVLVRKDMADESRSRI